MDTIKEKRLKLNIEQADLAKIIGVTQSTISRYERGERLPNLNIAKRLAAVLNCTVDDLIRNE